MDFAGLNLDFSGHQWRALPGHRHYDGPGHVVASSGRIYVPAWTTVSAPITVIGIGEVV